MIHPQKRQAQFKVASVSTNANSFGLLGHILVAKNGTAFECGKTRQFAHTKGDIVKVECHYPGGFFNWAGAGFEIPMPSLTPHARLSKKFGHCLSQLDFPHQTCYY